MTMLNSDAAVDRHETTTNATQKQILRNKRQKPYIQTKTGKQQNKLTTNKNTTKYACRSYLADQIAFARRRN